MFPKFAFRSHYALTGEGLSPAFPAASLLFACKLPVYGMTPRVGYDLVILITAIRSSHLCSPTVKINDVTVVSPKFEARPLRTRHRLAFSTRPCRGGGLLWVSVRIRQTFDVGRYRFASSLRLVYRRADGLRPCIAHFLGKRRHQRSETAGVPG